MSWNEPSDCLLCDFCGGTVWLSEFSLLIKVNCAINEESQHMCLECLAGKLKEVKPRNLTKGDIQ